MSKVMLAAFAAVTLSSVSILPAFATALNCIRDQCDEGPDDEERCADQLGHLKRVFPAEVAGVGDGDRVWVTEFCPSGELLRSEGNAAYLRPMIADNGVLVDALESKGYFPDDVFAVTMMGDDTINLYVHRFDDRR